MVERLTQAEWQAMVAGASPADMPGILADVLASGRSLPEPGGGRAWLSPEQVEALPDEEMRAWYRQRPGALRDRGDVQFFPEPMRSVLERLLSRVDSAYEGRQAS